MDALQQLYLWRSREKCTLLRKIYLSAASALLVATASSVLTAQSVPQGSVPKENPEAAPKAAVLREPYNDLRQQAIPPGLRSFFLAPWRAYLDTWPARQYLDCLGINFNVQDVDAEATARVLADAGFCSARIEFGWGNLDYDDQNQIRHPETYARIFRALREAGIRPLVVLNANSAAPAPFRYLNCELIQPALKGASELYLDKTDGIRPGYTGLTNTVPQKIAFPLITSLSKSNGLCRLSAPLPCDLPAGPLILAELKYHPFSGPILEDGTPNPWSQETIEGWQNYVRTVCRIAKQDLGTENQSDAGFDIEVWNEYTFGSDFLNESNYYMPKRTFRTDITYHNHGLVAKGVEAILPITVDYVRDPANRLPGVRVISGFSNQRPWENGATIWPGQTGFSRHFYTALDPSSPFHAFWGLISPSTNTKPHHGPIDALGQFEGKPDGGDWYSVTPGSYFIPTIAISMPEAVHYGYAPEYLTRDLQPFPSLWAGHYRFSNPGDGRPAEVWMTETNTGRFAWLDKLEKSKNLSADDPKLIKLSHHLGAKALLRTFVFDSHKGVHTIEAFAAHESDLQLAVIPEAFFTALKQQNHMLTESVKACAGEQLGVLSRVNQLMRQGDDIAVPRALDITEIVEHDPRLVFKGDGTKAHPDRFNRDDFACLPFQLTANRYAIPYYVVTQNMVHDWRPELDPLDPSRYDMPKQIFDVTISNLAGKDAAVSVWDPITNLEIPAQVLSSTLTSLTVQLFTVDYPRFLIVQESQPGPLISNPKLSQDQNGKATVSFETNTPVTARLTWGLWPQRKSGGIQELPPGTRFEYSISRLTEREGVHIEVERNGLTSQWPRWDYDVAGVFWPRAIRSQER